jgi:uncharacterized membrane-anchored protein
MVPGPATIPLLDQGSLKIGLDDGFIPASPARRLMQAMGNPGDDNIIGLIVPRGGDLQWYIAVRFDKIGLVSPAAIQALKPEAIYDELKRAGTGRLRRATRL